MSEGYGERRHPRKTWKSSQPSVLVLGGQHRNALGVVRDLGRRGIPVFVGSDDPFARSNWSRYASRTFTYPSPARQPDEAHKAILVKLREWEPDVLLPAMDEGWRLLYKHFDDYSQLTAMVPCPGHELFERMLNKKTMTKQAQQCGIPVPHTVFPESFDEALEMRHAVTYPALLKPPCSVAGEGITRVETPVDLARALRHFKSPPLIQEWIPGDDLELTLLIADRELVAASTYVSVRNAPLPFGPPVACRTIRDDKLVEVGAQLLKTIRFEGVAHLDFRRDRRDGLAKLLDFNARLAGTNELSTRSGVNFPLMLYKLALGEKPTPRLRHGRDLEFRWLLFGELRHLVQSTRKRQVIRDLLQWNNVSTDIRFTDPLPHVAHLIGTLKSR